LSIAISKSDDISSHNIAAVKQDCCREDQIVRNIKKMTAAGMIAAGFLLAPIASAMSLQAPVVSNGASKLVDPDEAIERMADAQHSIYTQGRFRAFSDSSMDARDAVRSQTDGGRVFTPFR